MTKTDSRAPASSGPRPQELLGCPFCGGKAYATRTVNGTQMFKVGCAECGIELKAAWYRDEDKPTKDLIGLWNTRANQEEAGIAVRLLQELVEQWRADAHRLRTTKPISAFDEQRADAREEDADDLAALLVSQGRRPGNEEKNDDETYTREANDGHDHP